MQLDRTAICAFEDIQNARQAARMLSEAGFDLKHLGFITPDTDARLDNYLPGQFKCFTARGIGPIQVGGALQSFFQKMLELSGRELSTVASLRAIGVGREDAELFSEALRHGHSILTLNCDETAIARVASILKHSGSVDIDKLAQHYRHYGFTHFDEKRPISLQAKLGEPGAWRHDLPSPRRPVFTGGVRIVFRTLPWQPDLDRKKNHSLEVQTL